MHNASIGALRSCRRRLDADEAQEDGPITLIGEGEFEGRLAGWALVDNLLRRELFVARPNPEQASTPQTSNDRLLASSRTAIGGAVSDYLDRFDNAVSSAGSAILNPRRSA